MSLSRAVHICGILCTQLPTSQIYLHRVGCFEKFRKRLISVIFLIITTSIVDIVDNNKFNISFRLELVFVLRKLA